MKKNISRRKFITRSVLGGTGLIVGTIILTKKPIRRALAEIINNSEAGNYSGSINDPQIWFEIRPDNTVVLSSPKMEMGQGTFTGLAQIAAEELGISFENMSVVHASSSSGNVDNFATGGSTSISSLWNPLRELAANTREMLKIEAALMLNEDASKLEVKNGEVIGEKSKLTFAEIIKGKTEWKIPKNAKLKSPENYTIIGKPLARIDLNDKVKGKPIFGIDAEMPEMLYGAVLRPTKIGSKFLGADISEAEKMPGVIKVVLEKDFVGVVAKSRTEAENAKNAIKGEWKTEKVWTDEEIRNELKVGKGTHTSIQRNGSPSKILDTDKNIISAEYESPIGAHAQLEPNGATAFVEKDKVTIIMGTQVLKITREEIAKRTKIKEENINVLPAFIGGGFGRRLHTPNAVQAAVLSQAVGKPVKCFFNRQDEFQNDTFRPPTHHVLKAKLDDNGLIEAMEHNVASGDVMYGSPLVPKIAGNILGSDLGAWRGAMIQYSKIPNFETIYWRVKLPFATSWWRSLGLLANTFAIESFIDELAIKAKRSPAEFRLSQIEDDERGQRLKNVIKKVVEISNYKDEIKDGKAMGFAASTDANTPVAQVVELHIEENEIKIDRVFCVIDPGFAVNPDQIRAQCEGCIIMGMSASMYEEMKVSNSELEPIIYGPYQMATMKDTPKEIIIEIINSSDTPGAVGEPPIGPIGAAIANAVYRLTNQRLRKMPLRLA